MTSSTVFRTLLALSVAIHVVVRTIGGHSWRPYHPSIDAFYPHLAAVTAIVVYVVLILILVGLWLFRPWARIMYVVIFALSLVSGLFRHGAVFVPFALLTLETLGRALDGAIITMAFLPPLREAFARRTA